jgi:hypothetical protein
MREQLADAEAQSFPGRYKRLETQLRDVFASCSGAVFEALLDILATVMEREVDDRRGVLVPSLRALSVTSSLTIPRECRNTLSSLHSPILIDS